MPSRRDIGLALLSSLALDRLSLNRLSLAQ